MILILKVVAVAVRVVLSHLQGRQMGVDQHRYPAVVVEVGNRYRNEHFCHKEVIIDRQHHVYLVKHSCRRLLL